MTLASSSSFPGDGRLAEYRWLQGELGRRVALDRPKLAEIGADPGNRSFVAKGLDSPVGGGRRLLYMQVRENYLVGRLDTPDDTRWETEIGWPIFPTAHH
jgi:hypothetical protein